MSRQLSLDIFFKARNKISNISESKEKVVVNNTTSKSKINKKISLSLTKSPRATKSTKIIMEPEKQVINICSDDEDIFLSSCSRSVADIDLPEPITTNRNDNSDSSEGTLLYSLTPEKPVSSHTPSKTPQSFISPKSSTSSRSKFYSPTKKRIVAEKTPVKRKLEPEFQGFDCTDAFNHDYTKDDKTKSFINIIKKCLEKESLKRLLAEESQMVLHSCLSVLNPGARVVCRLYWRKLGWYRVDQVRAIVGEGSQVDDSTFNLMLQSLIASGLLLQSSVGHNNSEGNLTFEDLAGILKADELKQICKDLKLKILSKQHAIDALRNYCRKSSIGNYFTGGSQSNDARVIKIMSKKAGPCFKLSDLTRNTLDKLYMLMYLGINYNVIREKRLELTILYDKIGRETYPVEDNWLDDASVVFENREQFDRYYTAQCIYEDFLERTDLKEKCDIISRVYSMYKSISEEEMLSYKSLPPWLRRYTPANIYIKILEAGVVELKRNKTKEHNTQAVDILTMLINQIAFRQHKKAEWYSEKALILNNMQEFNEAAMVLIEGLNSNLPEHAKELLHCRVRKMISKADQLEGYAQPDETTLEKNLPAYHIYKQPMERTTNRGKVKFETRLESERMIQDAEQYCISHYIDSGEFTHGGHWEGSIITTIFFLLFWDIIYSKPRGTVGIFLTRYQMFPLDLFTESFYTNRQTLIEERLAWIEACTTDEMVDTMSEKWNSRDECELSGVQRSIGWTNISGVSRCLGGARTAAVCRRLAADYRRSHCGFPDLALWHGCSGRIKFVEVKTDTDKPSMKQIQWMNYLLQNDIEVEFCYVGANTTRCKARAASSYASLPSVY
ncbi:fanconi-associated nuclease 1 isoform X2 [Amyelois transitella]|uniref:fanconi-associated nuclease 1 isoform X2 n=1 Tax=Amyelois transitella TaxID=680683 RepID=UPI0029907F8D|nr:fanconi-associated nuclease 1 isoform X2 [Amyelois transitella]